MSDIRAKVAAAVDTYIDGALNSAFRSALLVAVEHIVREELRQAQGEIAERIRAEATEEVRRELEEYEELISRAETSQRILVPRSVVNKWNSVVNRAIERVAARAK